MKKLLVSVSMIALLTSCTQLNTKVIDPLITTLSKINSVGTADLLVSQNVAKAATPPDLDGYACAGAAITVAGQIAQVTAAANVPNAGALTTAELATLFQPGSQQFNQAYNTLASGCIAKANDVVGPAGVAVGGGVIGLLNAGKLLPALAQ